MNTLDYLTYRAKILVAEDDEYNLQIICTYLKSFNAEIITVSNGSEAIQIVDKNPDLDLILMDVHMPVMNGLLATVELKKTYPKIPVVIVTASCRTDNQDIRDSGCDDFLLKPYCKEDLIAMVRKFLFIET